MKAKALSVLQNAYELPLREPLDPLDDTDLRVVVAIAQDTGGNEFDAAAAFMTMRIKSALEAQVRTGTKVELTETPSQLVRGLVVTTGKSKFHSAHAAELAEITELLAELKNQS